MTVSTGTLSLQGGGTISSSSAVQVATGGTLDFGGGTFAVSSGIKGTGSGAVSFSGGTANVSGTYNVSGSTIVSGGVLNLSGGGPAPATTTLNVSFGTLTGIDTLNVSGQTTWSGGTMSGTGTTNANGGLILGGTADNTSYTMFLDQRTFNNAGAALFQRSPSGAAHQPTLPLQRRPVRQPGGRQLHLHRRRHLRRQQRRHSRRRHLPERRRADQAGRHRLERHRLRHHVQRYRRRDLDGLLGHARRSKVAGRSPRAAPSRSPRGGTLDFGGGTFAVSSGITGTGSGVVSFSGGTANVSGTYNVVGLDHSVVAVGQRDGGLNLSGGGPALTTTTLNVSGGTLTGIDTLNVSGQTTWTGGTMSGTGTTNANGGLTLGGTAVNTYYTMFLDRRTLNNAGAALFQRSPSATASQPTLPLQRGPLRQPGGRQLHLHRRRHLRRQQRRHARRRHLPATTGAEQDRAAPARAASAPAITFNDSAPRRSTVSRARSSLQGGGTISSSSAVQVATGGTLDFGGGTFAVSSGITGNRQRCL